MSKRYAIISDIHSNIEALDAVLKHIATQKVDSIVCLGDVVGYNAAPSECIKRIRELGCKVVKGNHDHYCSHPDVDLDDFQPNAASVIEWTRRNISDNDINWLHNLPLSLKYMGFTIVHSTLDSPENYRYVFDRQDAADSFVAQGTRVCFHGHTHVPCIFYHSPGKTTAKDVFKYQATNGHLDPGNYFINVGSVGQPRDGDWRSCYAILTVRSLTDMDIEFHRVEYDVDAAVARIQEAGLPDRLIQRLYTGQ